jgi:23S rRNA (pseudouridine1915-N3)-methyltransferase
MRIALIAVGKARAGPLRAIAEDYAKRLSQSAGWRLALVEVEAPAKLPVADRMRREAELLAARVPEGAVLVALDRQGKGLASEDFAARLGAWRDQGRDVAFVIGGADGLTRELVARATLVLSFGAMTWPHMLARAMLLEQLYRASAILAGHPYHRGD